MKKSLFLLLAFSLILSLTLGCLVGCNNPSGNKCPTCGKNPCECPPADDGKGVDLVLFIGQSNMAGRGNASQATQVAEIVAVGPGGIIDGKEIVMEVKVGQKVITSKYAGTEVKCDGVEYTIVKQSDILAIVE